MTDLTDTERDNLFDASGHTMSGLGWSTLLVVVDRILEARRADEHERLRLALHAAWLAVHVRRFDGDYTGQEVPEYARHVVPDSIYNGTRLAEKAIGDVAAEHGIDYHALRRP